MTITPSGRPPGPRLSQMQQRPLHSAAGWQVEAGYVGVLCWRRQSCRPRLRHDANVPVAQSRSRALGAGNHGTPLTGAHAPRLATARVETGSVGSVHQPSSNGNGMPDSGTRVRLVPPQNAPVARLLTHLQPAADVLQSRCAGAQRAVSHTGRIRHTQALRHLAPFPLRCNTAIRAARCTT